MLGWDITDYGLGRFDEVGFSLITLRNGNRKRPKYTKTYAEKVISRKAQFCTVYEEPAGFKIT